MIGGQARIMTVSALALIMTGCAILQRESPEKKAREVMMAFQQSLTISDDEVLKFFTTDQSRESLLAAVNLLQHEDSDFVECEADFNSMSLVVDKVDESLRQMFNVEGRVVAVTVPVILKAKEGDATNQVDLVFRLREKARNEFVIYQLEGDDFYNIFTSMKHDIQYAQHQQEEIKKRKEIYALADRLQEKYEHVVWYVTYGDETFFYVAKGDWNEEFTYSSEKPRPDFKMGLVNAQGEEIIPIEFEMIGTIGAEVENAVEVRGPHGYGYFSITGDTLVEPYYQQIIPFPGNSVWVVQAEGTFGWVDSSKDFKEGFPTPEIEKQILSYSYLPSGITIKEGAFALCEKPNQEGAGSGLFITPSYWVQSQIMEPFKSGITTTVTDAPIGGWTEYIELGETIFQSIGDQFGVVIANFKERYLEGREAFYAHKKLLFKDSLQNTVLVQDYSDDDIEIKKVSQDVVEISSLSGYNDNYFEGMPMDGEMQGGKNYRYYGLESYAVTELRSNRRYPETQFVKLDDSYITGNIRVYNQTSGEWESLSVYPVTFLTSLRNEILADNGFVFANPETQEYYKNVKWYSPRFNTEEAMEESLSEIDKHNLRFLTEAIAKQSDAGT